MNLLPMTTPSCLLLLKTHYFILKNCLQEFAIISGLHCNFDKTALTPVFPLSLQEREWVTESGFPIVSKSKLLGAKISNNFDDLQG
jgi:hypothetical protein